MIHLFRGECLSLRFDVAARYQYSKQVCGGRVGVVIFHSIKVRMCSETGIHDSVTGGSGAAGAEGEVIDGQDLRRFAVG